PKLGGGSGSQHGPSRQPGWGSGPRGLGSSVASSGGGKPGARATQLHQGDCATCEGHPANAEVRLQMSVLGGSPEVPTDLGAACSKTSKLCRPSNVCKKSPRGKLRTRVCKPSVGL